MIGTSVTEPLSGNSALTVCTITWRQATEAAKPNLEKIHINWTYGHIVPNFGTLRGKPSGNYQNKLKKYFFVKNSIKY